MEWRGDCVWKMIKKIKKYGNTVVINFTKEELEAYSLKIGDFINISDLVKIKPKRKNGKNRR